MENNYILSVDIDWILSSTQYIELFTQVLPHLTKCQQIIFIDTHHNLINHLEEGKNSIVNIDHHHDLGVFDGNSIDLSAIHEGNWVNYLISIQRLEEYVWICNHNSVAYEQELRVCRFLDKYQLHTDLDVIKNRTFKKVVICRSFDYIPTESKNRGYGNMYDILKSTSLTLFKNKTLIDNINNPLKVY
jgi:hypothetical protein